MRAVLLTAALAVFTGLQASAPSTTPGPPRIYSPDSGDSWNRLFAALLTRSVRTRYTSEFPDRGPFQQSPERFMGPAFAPPPPFGDRVSTRVFDRYEEGDRAIDALYPTFLGTSGPSDVLVEPRRSELVRALTAALGDRTPRTPLARALMQADLWSAYDGLAGVATSLRPMVERSRAAAPALDEVSGLIATLIGQIALTRAQIAALPDNYGRARQSMTLPDVFNGRGEWIEYVFSPVRMHDEETQYRKASRIMVRPVDRHAGTAAFLSALRHQFPLRSASGVALVEQLMLIDRTGHVVPSPLVQDVQLRTFIDPAGPARSTVVSEFELSRRRILSDPASGGFVRFDDRAEAYLAVSGNDYGFASPARPLHSEATITTLHVRCNTCHGGDGFHFMSFAIVGEERLPPPRALPQPNDERARMVAEKKESRDDFKRLVAAAFRR